NVVLDPLRPPPVYARGSIPIYSAPMGGGSAIDRAFSRANALQSIANTQMTFIDNNNEQIDRYEVEINKKYSIPFACFVFVFVGIPLGIMARRGNFGVAATLSIGFFVIYWACLIGGEKLADRALLSPWLGMWMANIILGVLGIYLTLRAARENAYIDWGMFRRFVPKSMRVDDTVDAIE
ncbi:MAG TPA: LptF/LptG family permease, partial [Bacteroidota bacterium]|nr:LptF/LptG family permease [Bacteroidota bacterium]